jgi:ectoine hydroxylase-related dioxygenase (phytanoyl-CoA dioxygenase family)
MKLFTPEVIEEFDKEGVVFLPECLDQDLLSDVIKEYEQVESSLTNQEIPRSTPIVVFWTHVIGQTKRIAELNTMPQLSRLVDQISNDIKVYAKGDKIRLLETIIFNKPPKESNVLRWHQDVSYFPFEPNNQIVVWIPFDIVTRDSGALLYAKKSHKAGLMGSTNLHTGEAFENEDRPLIVDDPEAAGYEIFCAESKPGDMAFHSGLTWHMSGPNTVEGRQRRGLSLRFLVGDTYYKPRDGSAASFIKQIYVEPGDMIDDPAFPVYE